MYAHLWTRTAPPPPDYMELVLCRDVYHCTPVELAEVPLSKIMVHLQLLGIEAEVSELRSKERRGRK